MRRNLQGEKQFTRQRTGEGHLGAKAEAERGLSLEERGQPDVLEKGCHGCWGLEWSGGGGVRAPIEEVRRED